MINCKSKKKLWKIAKVHRDYENCKSRKQQWNLQTYKEIVKSWKSRKKQWNLLTKKEIIKSWKSRKKMLQDAELPQFTIKGFETNERKIKLATGTYQVATSSHFNNQKSKSKKIKSKSNLKHQTRHRHFSGSYLITFQQSPPDKKTRRQRPSF